VSESASDEAGAGACSIHSFTGDTPVLMADGSSQPIDTLQVGDQVADSKPDGHGTEKHRVDRVIVTHTDHDFVDLTITTKASRSRRLAAGVAGPVAPAIGHATATLTTTTHHPFWDVTTHTWTQAASLHPGDTLQTPTGRAQVVALRLYTATHTTYDLTIHRLHTYYVKAGTTPLLVHNCGSGEVSDKVMEEHILPRHSLEMDHLYPEFSDKSKFAEGVRPAQIRQWAKDAMKAPINKISMNNGAHRHLFDVGEEVGFDGETHVAVWVENGQVTSVHPEVP
jgi:hypothetical protein